MVILSSVLSPSTNDERVLCFFPFHLRRRGERLTNRVFHFDQIDKLLKLASASERATADKADEDEDPLRFAPNPGALVSKTGEEEEGGDGIYRPPKMLPTSMDYETGGRDAKELRRNKEQRRRASRSQLIKVRRASFDAHVKNFVLRLFAPRVSFREIVRGFLITWRKLNVPNLGQGAICFPSVNIQSRAGYSLRFRLFSTCVSLSLSFPIDFILTLFFTRAGTRPRGWRSAGRDWTRRRRFGAERVRQARNGSHGGSRSRRRRFVYARTAFQARATTPKGVDEKCQLARRRRRLWRRRRRSRRTHGGVGQGLSQAPSRRHRRGWIQGDGSQRHFRRTRCADARHARGEYFFAVVSLFVFSSSCLHHIEASGVFFP